MPSEPSAATAASDEPSAYLQPTICVDSEDAAVKAYASAHAGSGSDLERAVRLYYAVRDDFRYDPYGVELSEHGMKASTVLARNSGFCITKAALLAAACRAIGIPARLGFADVRNHLATAKMRERMGTDVFVYHGFAELFLEGRWVKATPAFNLSLCEKFGVLPLEFDGRHDSVFHPFDKTGQQHMEYLRDRGSSADVPVADIRAAFQEAYSDMYDGDEALAWEGDMEREAAAEAGKT